MEHATVARQPPDSAAPPPQGLELDVQAHLGRQLRAVYDEMAAQPVPDRFVQLLDALEKKQAGKHAVSAAGGASPAAGKAETAKRGDH